MFTIVVYPSNGDLASHYLRLVAVASISSFMSGLCSLAKFPSVCTEDREFVNIHSLSGGFSAAVSRPFIMAISSAVHTAVWSVSLNCFFSFQSGTITPAPTSPCSFLDPYVYIMRLSLLISCMYASAASITSVSSVSLVMVFARLKSVNGTVSSHGGIVGLNRLVCFRVSASSISSFIFSAASHPACLYSFTIGMPPPPHPPPFCCGCR